MKTKNKRKPKEKLYWIGFSGGEPHMWKSPDFDEIVVTCSTDKRKVRYEDKRLCRIVEVKREG